MNLPCNCRCRKKTRLPEEDFRRRITIAPFAIGRCEVTIAEFEQFVKETGYVLQNRLDEWQARKTILADNGCYDYSKFVSWFVSPDIQNYPVSCIRWEDAVAYSHWLSEKTGIHYRLPTEAEWEFAARAGTESDYFWGDSPSKDFANGGNNRSVWPDDNFDARSPVASFKPNGWGLYDVSGNVWEWTADCWYENFRTSVNNGESFNTKIDDQPCQRVRRGGSFFSESVELKMTARGYLDDGLTGFRIARSLSEEQIGSLGN